MFTLRIKALFLIFFCLICTVSAQKNSQPLSLKLATAPAHPLINADHADVKASANRSGFETGQVVKVDGMYHMFVNEMFDRPHRDMRISYWTSRDALDWKRQSTVVSSVPGRTFSNPRAEVWLTAVEFDEETKFWNIFYVAYRAGDPSKGEIQGNDYEGKIWRARSTVPGMGGISGPYADEGVVLAPDEYSQAWEGQQAVASFNPYKVGKTWYSMYDGHNHLPRGPWPTGIAFATSLSGPWTRMPEGFNPLNVVPEFMENAVVSQLKDGRYLMVFDSLGDQEIGYSLSDDGLRWTPEKRLKVQASEHIWTPAGDHNTRTPLCAIEEDDGSLTVIYTAVIKNNGKPFYAIGTCKLAWSK